MISSELASIWDSESRIDGRKPRQGRRVHSISARDVYAGVDAPGRQRFVAVRILESERRQLREYTPRSSAGIVVETVDEAGGIVTLFLHEQPGMPAATFPAVIADVLSVAAADSTTNALRRAFDRFALWQRALQRRTGPLAGHEVRGFIGELLVLRDVIAPIVGLKRAVDSWAAPGDLGLHDFAAQGWELEVKAHTRLSDRIHVSTTGQLESLATDPVFLCTVELEASPEGTSLVELAHSLVASAATDAPLAATIQAALVMRGLRAPPFDGECAIRYRAATPRAYLVTQDFPLIRRRSVPSAVTDVAYSVLLAALSPFAITTSVLTATLSGSETAQ